MEVLIITMKQLSKRFHRYIPQIDDESFEAAFTDVLEQNKIIQEEDRYYPYELYQSEINISQIFKRWLHTPLYDIDSKDIDKILEDLEKELFIEYDDFQKEAIKLFMEHSAMIITGGPGTGKTTIVNAMIKIYQRLNPDQRLAIVAPTGRAAKRLSEVTGVEACTIHRLLKWDLHTNTFAVNEKKSFGC